jgi:hypothetical protein
LSVYIYNTYICIVFLDPDKCILGFDDSHDLVVLVQAGTGNLEGYPGIATTSIILGTGNL